MLFAGLAVLLAGCDALPNGDEGPDTDENTDETSDHNGIVSKITWTYPGSGEEDSCFYLDFDYDDQGRISKSSFKFSTEDEDAGEPFVREIINDITYSTGKVTVVTEGEYLGVEGGVDGMKYTFKSTYTAALNENGHIVSAQETTESFEDGESWREKDAYSYVYTYDNGRMAECIETHGVGDNAGQYKFGVGWSAGNITEIAEYSNWTISKDKTIYVKSEAEKADYSSTLKNNAKCNLSISMLVTYFVNDYFIDDDRPFLSAAGLFGETPKNLITKITGYSYENDYDKDKDEAVLVKTTMGGNTQFTYKFDSAGYVTEGSYTVKWGPDEVPTLISFKIDYE